MADNTSTDVAQAPDGAAVADAALATAAVPAIAVATPAADADAEPAVQFKKVQVVSKASAKEAEAVTDAVQTSIPNWEARLTTALGRRVLLLIDFQTLLIDIPDAKARLKAVTALVVGARGVVNQAVAVAKTESTFAAVEHLVRVLELCCQDDGVKQDMAQKIHKIEFVARPAKGLSFGDHSVVYGCVPAQAYNGCCKREELLDFFEAQFYAQERALVTKFMHGGLPSATTRLQAAIGKPIVVQFDLVTMLGQCSSQDKRLPCARTIVTRTKLADKAAIVAKRTVNTVFGAAQAVIERAQSQPGDADAQGSEVRSGSEQAPLEKFDGPNVLLPVVEAIEYCCDIDGSNATAIGDALGSMAFVLVPGTKLVGTLGLHQNVGSPVVPTSPTGVPPIKNGVLVYKGCFEAGHKGCFTKADVVDFLEGHFRCREKSMVNKLMADIVPTANQRLTQALGRNVIIEVTWPAILHGGLDMRGRLEVCRTLTDENSKFLVQAMLTAMETVVHKADSMIPAMESDGHSPNALKAKVGRVVITSTPGKTAKPTLYLSPGDDGAPMSLVYTCALERGQRGCFDVQEFKAELRQLVGLPTPKDEQGISAVVGKVGSTAQRVKGDLAKGWGRFMNKLK